jgi:beta-lactamase class A
VTAAGAKAAPPPHHRLAGTRVAWVLTDMNGRPLAAHQPDEVFYAASTMKVAVLIAVFREVDRGAIRLDRPVRIANTFSSAIGGSAFSLDPDDVDHELADLVGDSLSVLELAERMITVSSNEATNLLLELVGFGAVAEVLEELGARRSRVERLIGDQAARSEGATNEVTPADLARLMTGIASDRAATPQSCKAMVETLLRQRYREEIAAALPAGTPVASKNGWVDGILHDAGLIWPEDAPPFCLVVCTEGFPDQESARAVIRDVAKWSWERRRPVRRAS